jgi:NADPH:quinone reductase-like Zn-dependent oxidoreductase
MRVFGTAGSPAKRTFVVDDLGADACFDSRGEWADELFRTLGEKRGLDVALDPVGGKATESCRRLLRPLGRLVFYGMSEAMPGSKRSWLKAALARFRTKSIHPLSLVVPNLGVFGVHLLHLKDREDLLGPALQEIYQGIVDGKWRPILDRSFPLTREGAVAAHHYLHDRKNLGKVVLEAGS